MFKKKDTKEEVKEAVKENKKELLVALLKAKTPTLFNRDPVIVGDVNKLADDILELVG
jgi:hypothetical protein